MQVEPPAPRTDALLPQPAERHDEVRQERGRIPDQHEIERGERIRRVFAGRREIRRQDERTGNVRLESQPLGTDRRRRGEDAAVRAGRGQGARSTVAAQVVAHELAERQAERPAEDDPDPLARKHETVNRAQGQPVARDTVVGEEEAVGGAGHGRRLPETRPDAPPACAMRRPRPVPDTQYSTPQARDQCVGVGGGGAGPDLAGPSRSPTPTPRPRPRGGPRLLGAVLRLWSGRGRARSVRRRARSAPGPPRTAPGLDGDGAFDASAGSTGGGGQRAAAAARARARNGDEVPNVRSPNRRGTWKLVTCGADQAKPSLARRGAARGRQRGHVQDVSWRARSGRRGGALLERPGRGRICSSMV